MNTNTLYKPAVVILVAIWMAMAIPAPLMAAAKEKQPAKVKMINLNFRDVSIMAVLELYSNLMGKTFIPDEKIRGNVTVISPNPIPQNQAIELFYSILDMKQLALVEYDTYFKVINKKDAAHSGLKVNIRGKGGDRMQTGIIHLKYANADAIVKDLTKLLSKEASIFAAKELNYLVITATAANIEKIEAIVKEIDKPGFVPETRAYKLQYLNAEKLSVMLSKMFDLNRSRTESRASIVPIKDSNSIVATATGSQHEMIQKLIDQVDIRKKQVSISAMLVEVSLTDNTKMGLEWLLQGSSKGLVTNIASDFGSLFKVPANVKKIAGEGLKLSVLQAGDFEILAHFLATSEDAKVISTPHILTMENQEAKLRVGNEVPVKKGTRFDSNNNEISTFEQFKVGLELVVTPVIADNRDITLKINQKLSNLISFDKINGTYKSSEREASTTVVVKDRQTLVIGGLISHETKLIKKGIPGLKDMPLIGPLFSSSDDDSAMRELLIFITPTVIMDEKEAEQVNLLEKNRHPLAVGEAGVEFDL
jgi:general secretion pathway protein D